VAWTIERLRADPTLQIRGYISDVTAVETPGPRTLVLHTRRPSGTLLNRLTNVYVLPRGDGGHGTGSGPFEVEAWTAGRTLHLRRRAGAPPTLPSRVEFDLARGPEEAVRGLEEGRYDIVRADRRGLERTLSPGRFTVRQRESLFTKMLAFDHARARTPFVTGSTNPYRDVRVRRAIHLALDRRLLVERLDREATPNAQPVPRAVFGFDPLIGVGAGDRGTATDLLAAAGFARGFSGTLHTRAVHAADARLVAAALAPLGIALTIEVPPDREYFELLARGGASLWFDRFGCTTGDAGEVLVDLLHTRDVASGQGTLNFGGFSDPEFDRLAEAVVALGDQPTRRRQILQEAMALTQERFPVVSLFNDDDVYAMDRGIDLRPRADSYLPLADLGLQMGLSPTADH
jgi:peptide/nickel transport system substrate-binding protein